MLPASLQWFIHVCEGTVQSRTRILHHTIIWNTEPLINQHLKQQLKRLINDSFIGKQVQEILNTMIHGPVQAVGTSYGNIFSNKIIIIFMSVQNMTALLLLSKIF